MDTRTVVPPKAIEPAEREESGGIISVSDLVEQIWGFIRRQYLVFLIVTACVIGLGLVYLLTTPARYTAHAMMLIDTSKLRVLQPQQASLADSPLDTTQIETQVEVLKSEGLGLSVVKTMHLADDAEFAGAGGRFWRSDDPAQSADIRQSQALDALLRQRAISRVGRTYVLDIAFTSLHPARAAEVANGIAEAYIDDQLESKYAATRRASKWLQDRIAELREQVSTVDRAVLDYKERNRIVDIAVASSPSGANTSTRSLEEQQLGEITTQLSAARAASTEAKARLDRIQDVLNMGVPDASVVDSLKSEIVIRLRNQYLDFAAREGILSQRYGSDHQAAINVRAQMAQIRQSITDELRRIAESTRSDYEIATAREQSLKNKLADMVSDARLTNRERIGLRELESNAQAIHTIYDSFLQRYMEAIQQQSFPITETRIIGPATAPKQKSSPRTTVVLGLATALGLALSLAIAALREALDPVFRSTRQVRETLQVKCLAVVPQLDAPPRSLLPVPWRRFVGGSAAPPATADALLGRAVLDPSSLFASAFRAIKVAVDVSTAGEKSRVIGVISTLPDEGKSTISGNLAELIAHVGKKVILIDGDLRNPTISRAMAADATHGLLEVLAGKVELDAAVRTVRGLAVLPMVTAPDVAHGSELLGSEALRLLVARLRDTYDTIIIDLPPLGPVAEVRSTAGLVDRYVQVIEWGRSRKNTVRQQLLGAPEIHERLLGVVLNKVDLREFARHENFEAADGQHGYY